MVIRFLIIVLRIIHLFIFSGINNSINNTELITKPVNTVDKTIEQIAEENKKLVVEAIKEKGGIIDD